VLWVILFSLWSVLLVPTIAYYLWMLRNQERRNVKADLTYQPDVSLIIPTYNEAAVIEEKLGNIQQLDYPKNKLQVILVDSASNDGTLEKVKAFLAKANLVFPITLLSERERLGKSHALNAALRQANGEIIATSDADSFWERDALQKAVSYFADLSIGAVTGRERLVNDKRSVHTLSESLYRDFYYVMRLGESNIHSTLIFQGELALYRRSAFEEFETRPGYSDDTGTVINIVSNGYRCIFVPEAIFSDTAAFSLRGRILLKSRRAEHLIAGIIRSVKLKIRKRLPLSSRVVFFGFYLHIVSPVLFVAALITAAVVYVVNFESLWFLAFSLILLLIPRLRVFVFSYLTSNLALLAGLFPNLTKRQRTVWRKIDEMRIKR